MLCEEPTLSGDNAVERRHGKDRRGISHIAWDAHLPESQLAADARRRELCGVARPSSRQANRTMLRPEPGKRTRRRIEHARHTLVAGVQSAYVLGIALLIVCRLKVIIRQKCRLDQSWWCHGPSPEQFSSRDACAKHQGIPSRKRTFPGRTCRALRLASDLYRLGREAGTKRHSQYLGSSFSGLGGQRPGTP